jgi:hypothetical protein
MLAEQWDGSRWTIQRTTRPARSILSVLDGAACVSESSCLAVGFVVGRTSEQVIPSIAAWPLLTSWNEGQWAVQPPRWQPLGVMYAASCTARTECTAVGADSLVEQMQGSRWTIARAPDPEQSNLYGVSCTASVCFAVGSWIDSSGWEVPLVESTTASR